jgi:hypothetical protein
LRLVGVLAALACLADIETVIAALLVSRIVIQFVGQIATVASLRTRPDLVARMPFRMRLFPLPALLALAGWLFIFAGSSRRVLGFGLASLALGVLAFAAWDGRTAEGRCSRADDRSNWEDRSSVIGSRVGNQGSTVAKVVKLTGGSSFRSVVTSRTAL